MFGISAFSQTPFSSLAEGPVILSGLQLNTSVGNVLYDPDAGWGRDTWGSGQWGIDGVSAPVTGEQLNISFNNSLNFLIDGSVTLTGQQLNITEGEVDANPDANVTGEQLNISLNSVTVTGTAILNLTGQQINISQGEEIASISVDVSVFSTVDAGWGQVAWGEQDWGQGELTVNLNISQGTVDPGPDVAITGEQLNISFNNVAIIGTAVIDLNGEQVNLSLNGVTADANTIPTITGFGLTSAVGTVFAGGNTDVNTTGNGLTVSLNSINNQIWTIINTGTAATWTEIDTAA